MQPAGATGSLELRKLTKQDISRLFSLKIYERGIGYFEEGRILRPFIYNSNIMAECQGTQPEKYHISIDAREGSIIASCTCPYAFGYCKHIAAVLYAWVKRPAMFTDLGTNEDNLMKLDRSHLVEIILYMIRYDPDVMYVITLRLTPVKELPAFVDREIKAIFSEEFVDYLNIREIVKKLDIFREYATDLFKDKKIDASLSVIRPVIDSIIENYTKLDDADGLMANFFGAVTDLFSRLISKIKDEGRLRMQLIQALDWYMDAEWGLENEVLRLIADTSLRLGQERYMNNATELKIADLRRSFIATSPRYSEEHEFIDKRIRRLNQLKSALQTGRKK